MGFLAVTKTVDCRRKASEFLRAAQLSSDPDESLGWLQLSDAWLTLAEQLERQASQKKRYPATSEQPFAELFEHRKAANVKVADILRSRLALDQQVPPPRERLALKVGEELRARLALKIDDLPREQVAQKVGDILRRRLALTDLTGVGSAEPIS